MKLGLIWSLIEHFQIKSKSGNDNYHFSVPNQEYPSRPPQIIGQESSPKNELLDWVKFRMYGICFLCKNVFTLLFYYSYPTLTSYLLIFEAQIKTFIIFLPLGFQENRFAI